MKINLDPPTEYPVGKTFYTVQTRQLHWHGTDRVEEAYVQTYTITRVELLGKSIMEGQHAKKHTHDRETNAVHETWEIEASRAIYRTTGPFVEKPLTTWRIDTTNGSSYSDIMGTSYETREAAEEAALEANKMNLKKAEVIARLITEATDTLREIVRAKSEELGRQYEAEF